MSREAPARDAIHSFTRVEIENNTVYDNHGVKAHTSGHPGDGIVIGQAGGGLIQGNRAYDNGWYSFSKAGGPAAIWCWDSMGLTFQHNLAHGNGSGNNADGDGFDLDGGAVDCTMQYNESYDNKGAGFLTWESCNRRAGNAANTVRYNLSWNNDRDGVYGEIYVGPHCTNNRYNNNTLTAKGIPVVILGGSGNQFINNIFISTGGNPVVSCAGTAARFPDNDYYEGNAPWRFDMTGGPTRPSRAFGRPETKPTKEGTLVPPRTLWWWATATTISVRVLRCSTRASTSRVGAGAWGRPISLGCASPREVPWILGRAGP